VDRVPIGAITNGVHAPSWVSTTIGQLYQAGIAADWTERCDEPDLWQRVHNIADEALWAAHQQLKAKLITSVDERTRLQWRSGDLAAGQVVASGVLLDPDALTIGFARRFATYKRATLIFRDVERLKNLLHAEGRPMQIIFAGKAHPADALGKQYIQQVVQFAQAPEFGGRVAFIEDYDLHIARFLVQGVDVWLNNPRRPMEASGTSGMKAAMNGVPNLSVLDGWWAEAYQPPQEGRAPNGWAFGHMRAENWDIQDDMDSQALYQILEQQIVPAYYDRDAAGIPRVWLQIMKEAIRTGAGPFSTRRMVQEYTEKMYLPAMGG